VYVGKNNRKGILSATIFLQYLDKIHLIYNQLNKPECMLMTHLLSAVFKAVVMLSQGSIHFRQE
jgi:hypothetical protein